MKTQIPRFVPGNAFGHKTWFRKALCAVIAALPVLSLADEATERIQEIVVEQAKAQPLLTPSAEYLNRSNAAPHILKILMDQHSKRGKKVGGHGTDYVFIGSLQSVLASLDEARNSFLAASEEDSALSAKQESIVSKLKTAAKPAMAQKERKMLSEMKLIDAIAREIRDVAPLVREFHAEERLQKAGAPLDR